MCSHWLSQACWQVATSLQQTCYKLDELNSLVTSCSNNLLSGCKSTTCQQVVSHKLGTTWQNNSIATNLLTCLLQARYKLVASTTCWQVVRFCVCRILYKKCRVHAEWHPQFSIIVLGVFQIKFPSKLLTNWNRYWFVNLLFAFWHKYSISTITAYHGRDFLLRTFIH